MINVWVSLNYLKRPAKTSSTVLKSFPLIMTCTGTYRSSDRSGGAQTTRDAMGGGWTSRTSLYETDAALGAWSVVRRATDGQRSPVAPSYHGTEADVMVLLRLCAAGMLLLLRCRASTDSGISTYTRSCYVHSVALFAGRCMYVK